MKFIKSLFRIVFFGFLFFFIFNLISFEKVTEQILFETETTTLKNKCIQEVDSQVSKVVEEFGGGVYQQEIEAIVPFFPIQVRNEWLKHKNEMMQRIGYIFPKESLESRLWENSAKNMEDLLQDAKIAAPDFRDRCLLIARKTNSVANFGIRNKSLLKSKGSLVRKVKQAATDLGVSEEQSVGRIRDALRGSIIVEIPEQIPSVVEAIKELAQEEKTEVVFINAWEENRPSGYAAVHAKLLLPIYQEGNIFPQKKIIVEIQIHLKCIMDGTPSSVKEREQLLYEQLRRGKPSSEMQNSASTLLYLTALKQCPKSLISKNISWQFQKFNHLSVTMNYNRNEK